MTPCKPSTKSGDCATCARYAPKVRDDAMRRRGVVINAAVVRKDGELCPLFAYAPGGLNAWVFARAA